MTAYRKGQRVRLDYPDGSVLQGEVDEGLWDPSVMFVLVAEAAYDFNIAREIKRGAQVTVLDEVKATN